MTFSSRAFERALKILVGAIVRKIFVERDCVIGHGTVDGLQNWYSSVYKPSNGGKEHKTISSFQHFVAIVEIEEQEEISFEYFNLKKLKIFGRKITFVQIFSETFEESNSL